MARLIIEERYPGEAHEKAGELIKAVVARLGGKVRLASDKRLGGALARATVAHPVNESGHEEHVHEEKNPTALSRDIESRIGDLASRQFDRMVKDVARFVTERRAANAARMRVSGGAA